MNCVVGVVGAGNWGQNVIRTFSKTPGCTLKLVCDKDGRKLERMKKELPHLNYTVSYEEMLADKSIQAIAIATDVPTHFNLASAALNAGKHVFVEKPLTQTVAEGQKLVNLARRLNKSIMVDHLLLHHSGVKHLKSLIDSGELGEVRYIKAARTNLGKIRREENVLWSFAPHDIAVIMHLLNAMPVSVACHGQSFVTKGIDDLAFLTMRFASGQIAHIHVSWLDPKKERTVVLVGDKKMAVFDDLETQEKIRIYDCGVDPEQGKFADFSGALTTRFGDIHIPAVAMNEPLLAITTHFVQSLSKHQPLSLDDHNTGLDVLRVLEAAQLSLDAGGRTLEL